MTSSFIMAVIDAGKVKLVRSLGVVGQNLKKYDDAFRLWFQRLRYYQVRIALSQLRTELTNPQPGRPIHASMN